MPQNVAGRCDDAAEQEWDAPCPALDLRGIGQHDGRRGNAGGQQQTRGCADVGDATR